MGRNSVTVQIPHHWMMNIVSPSLIAHNHP